jgi:inorganic phosphate transporter, PiT family
VAFLLTTLFTQMRIPTSTIQILVFSLMGTAVPLGLGIKSTVIFHLAALWVLAPLVACGMGYIFTKVFDLVPAFDATGPAQLIGKALILVGATASLTMGANDVSNATAVFVSVHFSGPLLAGAIGGVSLAMGVLTWGHPLLERVAFDVVRMGMKMATAAQLVQALVVLTTVGFGDFTSMNQSLIGAMDGTGLARGRQTIETTVVLGIIRGWIIGPGPGVILASLVTWAYRCALGFLDDLNRTVAVSSLAVYDSTAGDTGESDCAVDPGRSLSKRLSGVRCTVLATPTSQPPGASVTVRTGYND